MGSCRTWCFSPMGFGSQGRGLLESAVVLEMECWVRLGVETLFSMAIASSLSSFFGHNIAIPLPDNTTRPTYFQNTPIHQASHRYNLCSHQDNHETLENLLHRAIGCLVSYTMPDAILQHLINTASKPYVPVQTHPILPRDLQAIRRPTQTSTSIKNCDSLW